MTDKMPDRDPAEVKPVQPMENPETKKTTIQKPMPGPANQKVSGFEMRPSVFSLGEELIAIVRLLSAINQNLAFMARTIHDHLHPEDKGKDIGKKVHGG